MACSTNGETISFMISTKSSWRIAAGRQYEEGPSLPVTLRRTGPYRHYFQSALLDHSWMMLIESQDLAVPCWHPVLARHRREQLQERNPKLDC